MCQAVISHWLCLCRCVSGSYQSLVVFVQVHVRQLSVTGCVCAGACQAGTYSFDGLSPCTQCPLGFFQPQAGTSTCAECSSDQTTLARGATSANSCVDAGQYHIISPSLLYFYLATVPHQLIRLYRATVPHQLIQQSSCLACSSFAFAMHH